MLVRLSKTALAIAVISLLGLSCVFAQAPAKNWKDRGEYDLFTAITKEANAAKKLELLNTWKEKYPATDFKQERLQLYLTAYQGLNQGAKIIETAKEMLANDPKDMQGLYWITLLTPNMNDTSPAALESGENAAKGLLGNLDTAFDPAKKPATVSEADWKKSRMETEALADKTLGWVAMARKNNEAAEAAFRKSLTNNPAAAEVSYWMGSVLVAQKKLDKQAEALFHFARAATYTGAGQLNDAGRKQVEAYLEKVYNSFHGDKTGLDELRALAKTQALPPAGFTIKSRAEIEAEKEQEFAKSNPQLALWLNVKKNLVGPTGEQYFESEVKGAAIPKLRGKVISQKPPRAPKEVVLGIESATTPEITLVLENPMANAAPEGTEIEFEGVPAKFTKEPFMLTFEVENDKVSNWPKPAPPSKKAAAKKAVPKKK